MRKFLSFVLGIICISYSARAQIFSGTIVAFDVTEDKAVIAADSRAIFQNSPPDDAQCKIAAFSNHMIFALSGSAYYAPSANDQLPAWNAVDEAGESARINLPDNAGAQLAIEQIADNWARRMQKDWDITYRLYPDIVRRVADSQKGLLTNGVFILARKHQLVFADRGVRFTGNPDSITYVETATCAIGHVCTTGETAVADEFNRAKTPRAVMERNAWLDGPNAQSSIMYVIHLIELTIKYGPSDVGGPVDALEMTREGIVTWKRRKPNCPEEGTHKE